MTHSPTKFFKKLSKKVFKWTKSPLPLPNYHKSDLKSFETRLRTFEAFTGAKFDRKDFASYGLYYSGKDNIFKCYRCETIFKYPFNIEEKISEHAKITIINEVYGKTISLEQRVYDYDVYNYEIFRLISFNNFPNLKAELAEEMAKEGLTFLFDEDRVQCFFCKEGMFLWEQNDCSSFKHENFNPNCPFFKKTCKSTNVPTDFRFSDIKIANISKITPQYVEYFFDTPLTDLKLVSLQNELETYLSSSKITLYDEKFIEYSARLNSFKNLEKSFSKSMTKNLALNGFSLITDQLQTKLQCFGCGMIFSWYLFDRNSVIMIHYLCSPQCPIIKRLIQITKEKNGVFQRRKCKGKK